LGRRTVYFFETRDADRAEESKMSLPQVVSRDEWLIARKALHYYLDMTAGRRQEDWEEPAGRASGGQR
jgi:hypothetical protein